MNWFRKLFGLCEHKWQILTYIRIVDEKDDTVGTKYVLQCQKCGNVKSKRV